MAILPDFARHHAKAEHRKLNSLVAKSIRLLLYIFLPVTIFLLIFRGPIIDLYISIGHAITAAETDLAVRTFGYFVISLFFQGAVLVLARAYFARSDTYRPALFSIVSIVIAYLVAKLLTTTTDMGVTGLALAFSVGSTINAFLLWFNIGLPLRTLWRDDQQRLNIGVLLVGNAVVGIFFYLTRSAMKAVFSQLSLSVSLENLLIILISLAVGLIIYLSWSKVFNLEQWQLISKTSSTEK